VNCYSMEISVSEGESAEKSFSRVARLLYCVCEAVE
jgi:hypothetical protein